MRFGLPGVLPEKPGACRYCCSVWPLKLAPGGGGPLPMTASAASALCARCSAIFALDSASAIFLRRNCTVAAWSPLSLAELGLGAWPALFCSDSIWEYKCMGIAIVGEPLTL